MTFKPGIVNGADRVMALEESGDGKSVLVLKTYAKRESLHSAMKQEGGVRIE